jgi:hypothetical protein
MITLILTDAEYALYVVRMDYLNLYDVKGSGPKPKEGNWIKYYLSLN